MVPNVKFTLNVGNFAGMRAIRNKSELSVKGMLNFGFGGIKATIQEI